LNIADFIQLADEEPSLRFLVIGGHAVAAHGFARTTLDVDFLAMRSERATWVARAAGAGLSHFSRSSSFDQFNQNEGGAGLDLMYVEDPTFEGMWTLGRDVRFGPRSARIPCIDHLIALKLHNLKQTPPHRGTKDVEDVEMLVRQNGLDLREPRFEPLFAKLAHGRSTPPAAECSKPAHPAEVHLVFPVDPDFRSLPPKVSMDRYLEFNRQIREWFPGSIPTEEERLARKVDVEFVL
jgi:hypothetical protein